MTNVPDMEVSTATSPSIKEVWQPLHQTAKCLIVGVERGKVLWQSFFEPGDFQRYLDVVKTFILSHLKVFVPILFVCLQHYHPLYQKVW